MSKNKSSKIKFINTSPRMKDIFPKPSPAIKDIPSWYKKVEGFYDSDSTPYNGNQNITVKRCVAFLDILSSGYMMKAPFDIYIDTTEGKQVFDIPQAMRSLGNLGSKMIIGSHDMKQVPGYPFDKDQYIEYLFRVNLMWVVETDPGFSTLFIQPQHHELSPLYAISAVIDTDGFPSNGLFSFLVKKDFKGFVAKGTPLVQAIPFKRTNFESEIIETEEGNEYVKKVSFLIRTVFNSGYKKFFWKKKTYR
jgi:hypothetical protein